MLRRGYKEHTTPRTSVLRLLVLVVLMGATVWAINWGVGRFLDRRGTNLGYVYIAHKWHVLETLDEPVDWLVLGDSSGSQGFDPSVLEQTTGKRAINLGTLGNFGLYDDLWMLEEYIERFGPPERVVLIHVYDVWRRRLKTNLVGRIPRDWVLTEETAERYDFDEDKRKELMLNRYVRLYADRTSLRKTIQYNWQRLISDEEELAEIRRKDRALPVEDPELMDDGFVRMCGDINRVVKSDARGHMKFVKKNRRARISKDNRTALLEIAKLAEEHGFTVTVVNGPLYERLRIKEPWQRYFKSLVQQIRSVVKDHPQVEVIDQVLGFDGDKLQNVDHITCDATEEYTRWVIERIAQFESESAAEAEDAP